MRRSAALLLVLPLAVTGCFGSGGGSQGDGRSERGKAADRALDREQAARAEALHGLPRADRIAFYQAATGLGSVRARAALLALGRRPGRGSAASLRASARRLRSVHPRNASLVALRRDGLRLAAAALTAPAAGPSARRAGARLVRSADRLSRRLDRLVRRDPRFSALVPD